MLLRAERAHELGNYSASDIDRQFSACEISVDVSINISCAHQFLWPEGSLVCVSRSLTAELSSSPHRPRIDPMVIDELHRYTSKMKHEHELNWLHAFSLHGIKRGIDT